jgi:restriction system protein
MSRNKKSGALEDLFEIMTKVPWWIGVVLAIGFYLGLHAYASQVNEPLTNTAQAASLMVQTVFKTLAGIFQYILPLVCLAGAAVSAWKNSQGKSTGQFNATSPVAPSCPACGSRMVKREAKRGTKAGGYFWGCSEYPKCRGTVQI